MINILNEEAGKSAVHRVVATCSSDGNARSLWNISSPHRFTSHAHAESVVAGPFYVHFQRPSISGYFVILSAIGWPSGMLTDDFDSSGVSALRFVRPFS